MQFGHLRHSVTLLMRAETQVPPHNSYEVNWLPLDTVWANVQDMLPSRGERLADGVNVAARPCRVRIHYRTDIDNTMRLTIDGREGEWRIISQPAEIGWREWLEFVCEQLTTEGQEP